MDGSHHIRNLITTLGLLALVVGCGSALLATQQAHLQRTRGIPHDYPAPVRHADVPLLGVNVSLEQYPDERMRWALERISRAGITWVRQSFYWCHTDGTEGKRDWRQADRIVSAVAEYPRLRLIAVLDECSGVPPEDPALFAAFGAAFADRYANQIDHYQIWDEPNLGDRWGGGPVGAPAYADLLARTATAIRTADSTSVRSPDCAACILLAGLAPTIETGPRNLSEAAYLDQLYLAGAAPYFDIVTGKPYGFDTGPEDRRVAASVLNFSRLLLLREVMVEHGDGEKAIWASQWGWNALPDGWGGEASVWGQTDEVTQARHTIAALERVRSEWPWVGAMVVESFQPLDPDFAATGDRPQTSRWGFSLMGPNGQPRPVYDAISSWFEAQLDAAPVGGHQANNPWATYTGTWTVGPLAADTGSVQRADHDAGAPSATFRFTGTSAAVTVRRGPYRGFLYATVDGQPANALPLDSAGRAYIVLYGDRPAIATVPLASGLAPGLHTLELTAEGGDAQWSLVDWRVGAQISAGSYSLQVAGLAAVGLLAAVLLVSVFRTTDWSAIGNGFLGWPEWVQLLVSASLVGLLWAAAAASIGAPMGQVLSADGGLDLWPLAGLALAAWTAPVLVAVLALRPDFGLGAVACSAPLYLLPGGLYYHALSLPEALIVLCVLGRMLASRCSLSPYRAPRRTATSRVAWGSCHRIDVPAAMLIAAAVLASAAARDKAAALFDMRSVFLMPALYYILLATWRGRHDEMSRVIDWWMMGAVVVAVLGLVKYVTGQGAVIAEGGLPRLQSVYHSPNSVGLYLGRAWPVLLALSLWSARGGRRVLYTAGLVPVSLALVLSLSRGAILLALPAAVLVMGWLKGGKWTWVALGAVGLSVLGLVPLLRVPRFASLLDLQQGSTFFRLALWRSTLRLIGDHPLLGVGPGNFVDAYRTRYILPIAWQEFNLEHPHSLWLDHWTRLGLLGLIAGVALQVFWWRGLLRVRGGPGSNRDSRGKRLDSEQRDETGWDALGIGLAGSMAALLAHGVVDNALFYPDLALTFCLMLVGLRWKNREASGWFPRSEPRD